MTKESTSRARDHGIDKFLYQEFETYRSFVFGYERDNPSDEFFRTKILGVHSSSADKYPENTLYTSNLLNAKAFFESKLKQLDYDHEKAQDIFRILTNNLLFNFYEIDDELDVCVTFETMNNCGRPLTKLELLKNRLIFLTTILKDETRSNLRKDINECWKTIYEYLGERIRTMYWMMTNFSSITG